MPEMKSCAYCGPLAEHTTEQCRNTPQLGRYPPIPDVPSPSEGYAELEGEVVARIGSVSPSEAQKAFETFARGLSAAASSTSSFSTDASPEKTVPKNAAQFPHYFKSVEGLTHIDAYRVIDLWEITDPCIQHALKKLLAAGKRGAKDAHKDVGEAIASLQRWQEMRVEETTHVKVSAPMAPMASKVSFSELVQAYSEVNLKFGKAVRLSLVCAFARSGKLHDIPEDRLEEALAAAKQVLANGTFGQETSIDNIGL